MATLINKTFLIIGHAKIYGISLKKKIYFLNNQGYPVSLFK